MVKVHTDFYKTVCDASSSFEAALTAGGENSSLVKGYRRTHMHARAALNKAAKIADHITINKNSRPRGLQQSAGRELLLTSGLKRRKQG